MSTDEELRRKMDNVADDVYDIRRGFIKFELYELFFKRFIKGVVIVGILYGSYKLGYHYGYNHAVEVMVAYLNGDDGSKTAI